MSLRTRSTGLGSVIALMVVVSTLHVLTQELTLQARLAGPWQIDPARSAAPWVLNPDDKKKTAGPDVSLAVKALVQLTQDLIQVPARFTITASSDSVAMIDDHGLMQRFTVDNKGERITYGASRPTFRSHWEDAQLVQDISGDAVELTRNFEVTPDGKQLTLVVSVRRIPDASLSEMFGQLPATKTFVYTRP